MKIINKLYDVKNRIDFGLECLKKGSDKRFVEAVRDILDNKTVLLQKGNGNINDSMVYYIEMEPSHTGFFAVHNNLLSLLYFADYYGMIPVIKYPKEYCYSEKEMVNGTDNPFEYYYEQPCDLKVSDIRKRACVVKSRKIDGNITDSLNDNKGSYYRNEKYISEMARITRKYLHFNESVKNIVFSDINSLFADDKILGIHYRGTDFKNNYNGHPIQVNVKDYIDAIQQIIIKKKYDKIFIATDDIDALNCFKEKFGECVIYFEDVIRGCDNTTVMESNIKRDNHHYLLGLEVIRDMIALSKCNGLIAGLSQVSFAARIQKKSENLEYEDIIILDKGINYHKKQNCPT